MIVWWLIGCGGAFGDCDVAPAPLDVSVDTSGEVPVFDWTPGTGTLVEVYDPAGETQDDWQLFCGSGQFDRPCIEPPIAYGDLLNGRHFDAVVEGSPLESGREYEVTVMATVSGGPLGCGERYLGSARFVAP